MHISATGKAVVNRIFSDLAIIDVTKEGLIVREKIDDISFKELQEKTGVPLIKETYKSLQTPTL